MIAKLPERFHNGHISQVKQFSPDDYDDKNGLCANLRKEFPDLVLDKAYFSCEDLEELGAMSKSASQFLFSKVNQLDIVYG